MDNIQAFDYIARTFREAHPLKAEDFTDGEGFVCCGNCKDRKEMMITVLGAQRKVPRLCRCERAELEAAQEKAKENERKRMIERNRKIAFPDTEMANLTFSSDDHSNPKLTGIAKRYCDNFDKMLHEGKGLLLFGEVGTGKTFIAACIANTLIEWGYKCLVTNFARLVNTIQSLRDDRQEYIDSLNEYHLLVIDDLAAERDTEYMQEIVTNIIDARYRSKRPLIITTNLTAAELKNPAEVRKQRIYSRLLEMCIPINVEGKDRRKEKLKSDYNQYKDMLGL